MSQGLPLDNRCGRLSRRVFLHRCAICAGTILLPPAWAKLLVGVEGHSSHAAASLAPTGGPLAFKFFTPEHAATVEAITEQIIPADEDPGAKWAGVVHYIDLGLAGEFAKLRPVYEAGLTRVRVVAREFANERFERMDFVTQTRILEKLERDDLRQDSAPSGREFFELVRRQTLEGFFGDPKYGGNRDSIGWKVLKFEG